MIEIIHSLKLLNYTVEILDKPFEVEKGPSYDKTALVSFYNHLGKVADKIEYGVVDLNSLYEQIKSEEKLNLNNTYIKNFSLEQYKKINEIGEHDPVTLNSFTAKESFFDCDVCVDFSNAVFMGKKTVFERSVFGNGTVNFTGANFAEGNISFKHTRFGDGKIIFNDAVFGGGDISFQEAMFGEGDLFCVNTNFGSGKVDFKGSDFGDGIVDFKYAKFGLGDTTFEKSVFGSGRKDFKAVEFGGRRIDFRRVEFGDGDISFEGTEFGDGKVMFRSANFGNGEKNFEQAHFGKAEVSFEHASFAQGKVSFETAIATNVSFKHVHLDSYFDLRFAECANLDLSDTIVRDILDIKSSNGSSKITSIDMSGMKLIGRIFIDWRENKVKDLIYGQQETTLFQKAEQFRMLKENFRNIGQYDDEDYSYVEFKRCESKAELLSVIETKNKKDMAAAYFNYYFQKYIFDYIGRYATQPVRVLYNMLLVYTGYSLFYSFLTEFFPHIGSLASGISNADIHAITNCFYYSAITFFTIGYGEYYPEGILKFVAACEGFSGVFLMSYFTVAFVRKILR